MTAGFLWIMAIGGGAFGLSLFMVIRQIKMDEEKKSHQ